MLVDGAVAGIWHARKRGKTLAVTVKGTIPRKPVKCAAERLVPHRGCVTLSIEFA